MRNRIRNTGWGSVANWPQQSSTSADLAAADAAHRAEMAALIAARDAAPTTSTPPPDPQPDPRTHYMDAFRAFFAKIGMSLDAELEAVLKGAIDRGYTDADIDIIMPDIQNTQAFKTRFAGYHQRISNGYNAVSIGQYLELEDAYHRVMQEAGLPSGFYDDPSDFGDFIAKNISVDEIRSRVGMAVDLAKQVDPTMRELMTRFYGLSTGDVAAYFLDSSRALPAIEHQYKSAGVASWAQRNGFAVSNMQRFEQLVADGVTVEAAAQGYGTAKALYDAVGKTASIYGESYDQTDAEQDVFFNKNEKRRRIMAQEQATFSGQSKGATGSASRSDY